MDVNVIGIIGTVVTISSFIYAIYENRRHAKLVNYNREQAWEIYRQITKSLFYYQELERFKIDDRNLVENISKGEMATQELLINSIRMIKRFEKKFDFETIDVWYKHSKLPNESHVKAFKSLV